MSWTESVALSNVLRASTVAVVPVLVGPLQVLLALLPAALVALGTAALAIFRPSVLKQAARVLWTQKLPLLMIAAAAAGVVSVVRGAKRGARAARPRPRPVLSRGLCSAARRSVSGARRQVATPIAAA